MNKELWDYESAQTDGPAQPRFEKPGAPSIDLKTSREEERAQKARLAEIAAAAEIDEQANIQARERAKIVAEADDLLGMPHIHSGNSKFDEVSGGQEEETPTGTIRSIVRRFFPPRH